MASERRSVMASDTVRTLFVVACAMLALAVAGARARAWSTEVAVPTDTLRGLVTDADGKPLAAAEVGFPELGRRALTGSDGTFLVAGLPGGRYTLVVERLGYAPVVRQVAVGQDRFVVIALRETAFALDGITVTATRTPVEALGSPLAAAALSGERLAREQSLSLADALDKLAGVRNLSTGGQVGKPVIRGLTGARVLVLDNGLRVEDYSWGEEHGPAVEPRLAQRVEVIRGPASVLYGSDALGGVVNVVPEELPEAEGPQPFVRTGFELYGGSNNREVGGLARLEGADGSLGWRAVVVGRRAADLRTPRGPLFNSGFQALSGEGAAGLRGEWGNAVLRYSRYAPNLELVGGEGEPGGGEPGSEEEPESPLQKLRDDRVQLTGNFVFPGVRVEAKGQWQRNWRREFEAASAAEPVVDLLLNTYSLDVLGHDHLGDRARGTAGVSALYQRNDTRGEEPLVPDARTAWVAAFAFEQMSLGRWTVSVGARGDVRRLEADANEALGTPALTRNYAALSGNLGAVYRVAEGLVVAANLARGWRAPTLFELLTFGLHLGQARYEIGRADLGPEVSVNADLGVRWELGAFRGEVAGYRNRIREYIYLTPTGQFRDGFRVYAYGQADALLWGGEVSWEVEPFHALTLRGRADYVHGTNEDTGEPLPLTPPARADLEAELHFDRLSWAERAYVSVETELVGEQTRLSEFDVPTDGYALLHLGLGLERRLGGWPVRVGVAVRNATNAAYRDFLSRYKEFALNPGRNVVVRLSASPARAFGR